MRLIVVAVTWRRHIAGRIPNPVSNIRMTPDTPPEQTQPLDPGPKRRDWIRSEGIARGWRTGLREFVIIVAGVLCALAAQSWWETREDRQRERDYVRQLLEDTRENERRLDAAVAADSVAARALGRVAGVLFGRAPLPEPDTLVKWFRGETFSSSDFQPLTGTYRALLTAGDLRLIGNDTLRALLVAYAATLEHEEAMLRLFLEQSAGAPDRLAAPMPFLRGMFFDADSLRPRDIDFERLRHDGAAEAVFFALQVSNANRLTHLKRLREATSQLRRALESEAPAGGNR